MTDIVLLVVFPYVAFFFRWGRCGTWAPPCRGWPPY
jgi:hypothetical protein